MKYGDYPELLDEVILNCEEMLFYQYLPIKLPEQKHAIYEKRLHSFRPLIDYVINDFKNSFGYEEYINSYVYLTAKKLFQTPNNSFNRSGYHSDGFLTDDINYIWSDKFPTIFNIGEFNLTLDDFISMSEMESQAKKENEVVFPNNQVIRLNQYNIHKVGEITENSLRTFAKLSFSKDKYDLEGNSHNYLIDYKWDLKKRKEARNIPQSNLVFK